MPYFEISDPSNWEDLQQYLDEQAALGTAGPPTVATISIDGDGNKWYGGVLAPNGKIYCVPGAATSVLIIDPQDDSADASTIIDIPVSGGPSPDWLGGVLAPNGKIYCIPWQASNVLIIDPATDTFTTKPIPESDPPVPDGSSKWHGGVLAPNGKIYCIPYDSDTVLVIDPDADTFDTIPIPDPGSPGPSPSDPSKWYGGVLAPNGKIYCIPWKADYVMIIDPESDTMVPDAISFSAVADLKWTGGVLSINGRIYCIPQEPRRVLIIDPATTTVELAGYLPLDEDKWAGGVLGPDGRIYGIPRNYHSVLVIDPIESATDPEIDPDGISLEEELGAARFDEDKWTGGVLATNGKIYCVPNEADSVLIIDPHSNGQMFASIAECPYFNKF
jgi:streptogramin lyase